MVIEQIIALKTLNGLLPKKMYDILIYMEIEKHASRLQKIHYLLISKLMR